MTDWRTDAIEAGARALDAQWWGTLTMVRDLAAAVVDAVAPIVRADERAKNAPIVNAYRQSVVADLRAQVEALPVLLVDAQEEPGRPSRMEHGVLLSDVLALLEDGAQ
jgi:type IV secretory pathway VirJ component